MVAKNKSDLCVKGSFLCLSDIKLDKHLLSQIPEKNLIECEDKVISHNGIVLGHIYSKHGERANIQFLWESNGRLYRHPQTTSSRAADTLKAAKIILNELKSKKFHHMSKRDEETRKLTKKALVRMVKEETHISLVSNSHHLIDISHIDEEVRDKKKALVHDIDARMEGSIAAENTRTTNNLIRATTDLIKTSDIQDDDVELFAKNVIDRLSSVAAAETALNVENERLFQETKQIFVLENQNR